jgi:cytochrome b561
MQLRNSSQGYGAVALVLHWLTVGLVALAWLLGTFGDELPPGAARSTGLAVHISLGLAVLALLVARVLWRLADPPPPAEVTRFGAWMDTAARLTHFLLYALLIAVPIVGIVVQFARGAAVPIFGVVEIASPWVQDRAFAASVREIHETLANGLMIVAALHAGAALVHHWLLRDRTLLRMLPRATRR